MVIGRILGGMFEGMGADETRGIGQAIFARVLFLLSVAKAFRTQTIAKQAKHQKETKIEEDHKQKLGKLPLLFLVSAKKQNCKKQNCQF